LVEDFDTLRRQMAMKIIRSDLMARPKVLARFIEEAQCSAQLQHPGIVPVHELGRLPDGRFYFTMAEVKGRTLSDVIAEVHGASEADRWQTDAAGWTFRGPVDAFDPSWCHMKASHRGCMLPACIGQYPVDESVYGARGMAGNSRDWTGTAYQADSDVRDGAAVSSQQGAGQGGAFRGTTCHAGRRQVSAPLEPVGSYDLLSRL